MYPNMRRCRKHYGEKNTDKIIYIIRPRTDCIEGLMSLFMNAMKQLGYAEKHGYIPVIDFENYETQYMDGEVQEKNVWNYYFTQPIKEITVEEAYESANVILAGFNDCIRSYRFLDKDFNPESLGHAHMFYKKYITFSDDVIQRVVSEEKSVDPSNMIGMYLRGTDYIAMKPAGEAIQPTPEQAFEVVDQMVEKYGCLGVYLVTEDERNYELARKKYAGKLKIVSFDRFVSDYNGDTFLSQSCSVRELSESPYIRGMNYLVKLIILSHCKCIVGGNTCGSWAACVFADESVEKYIFDLGIY